MPDLRPAKFEGKAVAGRLATDPLMTLAAGASTTVSWPDAAARRRVTIVNLPSAQRLLLRVNASSAAADDWEHYVDGGDTLVLEDKLIRGVALYNAGSATTTYKQNFSVHGEA